MFFGIKPKKCPNCGQDMFFISRIGPPINGFPLFEAYKCRRCQFVLPYVEDAKDWEPIQDPDLLGEE